MNLNRGELTDLIEALEAFDHFDPLTKEQLLEKLENERGREDCPGVG